MSTAAADGIAASESQHVCNGSSSEGIRTFRVNCTISLRRVEDYKISKPSQIQ
ncbi:hypothetical protein [Candidatus Magnetomonas plexicatena]|uniref:hypothetical protein n=1 Tax=Candidatus Magnetomonas plexicatena TaxID=2552947 RepID=UPI001C78AAD3|nr:hypothetical protein E2O03_007585 [Nitrospirales bacterium LBB_01]